MPNTRVRGKPLVSYTFWTMASRGLVTAIMMQLGEYLTTCSVTEVVIFMLVNSRSSRLIPGRRAMPAVITTTSEPADSS